MSHDDQDDAHDGGSGAGAPRGRPGCGGGRGGGGRGAPRGHRRERPRTQRGGPAGGRPVELEYWDGWTGVGYADPDGMVAKIMRAFTQKHPALTVRQEHLPGGELVGKLTMAVVPGTAPDVVMLFNSDGKLYSFAHSGQIQPLEQVANAWSGRSRIRPTRLSGTWGSTAASCTASRSGPSLTPSSTTRATSGRRARPQPGPADAGRAGHLRGAADQARPGRPRR